MSDETPPEMIEAAVERPSIAQLFSQLRNDAVDLAAAELAVVRAEMKHRARQARPGLVLLIAGLALVFGTAMVLPVVLVIILAPLIGAWLALLAVAAAGSISAFLCFISGIRLLKTARKKAE